MEVVIDAFEQPLVASASATLAGWNAALNEMFSFRGDPGARLMALTENDAGFVMGLVVTTAGEILGGADPQRAELQADLLAADYRSRSASPRERNHVEALITMVEGNFTQAAQRWDAIAAAHPHDLIAIRMAHDLYLHVGDSPRRLQSSQRAAQNWTLASPGQSWVNGELAFAFEESGHFAEAEEKGLAALAADPDDAWALHALAHVYESQQRHQDAMDLLTSTQDRWETQNLFSTHLIWHLAIRLIASGEITAALAVFDDEIQKAERGFAFADLTSLIWRAELAGYEVGDRWQQVADCWATVDEHHHSAFLDVHASMAFATCPESPAARQFWVTLEKSHNALHCENDEIFAQVVKPLGEGFRQYRNFDGQTADALSAVFPALQSMGGSVVQRQVVKMTQRAAKEQAESIKE